MISVESPFISHACFFNSIREAISLAVKYFNASYLSLLQEFPILCVLCDDNK